MFNISIKTIISVTGDQKRMTYTYIKKVMHQCRCTSHCHFRRLIQLRHPCDTEVLQVQSAPPVCSHNAQINSRHIYISTVHVKRCRQQKCDMWPMCTTAYVCQLHRPCMDKRVQNILHVTFTNYNPSLKFLVSNIKKYCETTDTTDSNLTWSMLLLYLIKWNVCNIITLQKLAWKEISLLACNCACCQNQQKSLTQCYVTSCRMRFVSHKVLLVSHETASSSAECSRDKPPFSFVREQDSTMWDIVWVLPQRHRSVSVSRHFLLQVPQCPCYVTRRNGVRNVQRWCWYMLKVK